MNWIALRVWLLLFWMMAGPGIFCSSLAQQAGPAGTALVMDGRAGPAASGDKLFLTTQERQWLPRHDRLIPIGITIIAPQVLKVDGRHKWSGAIQVAKARRIGMVFAAQQASDRLKYLLFSVLYIEVPDMLRVRRDRPVLRRIRGQGPAAVTDQERWDINLVPKAILGA